jgi:hypothetical protein
MFKPRVLKEGLNKKTKIEHPNPMVYFHFEAHDLKYKGLSVRYPRPINPSF